MKHSEVNEKPEEVFDIEEHDINSRISGKSNDVRVDAELDE